MLSTGSGSWGTNVYPDATSDDIVIHDRVHLDAHLLLWCIEGAGEVDIDGAPIALHAGIAVLVAAGLRHSVSVREHSLVYPVFLPADRVRGDVVGSGAAFPVSPRLADALLLLSVATTTFLSPPDRHIGELSAVIAELGGEDEGAEAELPELPTPFIPWIVNDEETVAIWCVTGRTEVTIGDEDAATLVELGAEQALVVPVGIRHRIHGAPGNVTIPVFIPAGIDEIRIVRVNRELRKALHAQNLADTTLFRPRRWDGSEVVRALAAAFSVPVSVDAAAIGPAAARAAAVMAGLMRHPGDRRGVGEWARSLGVTPRTLERAFAEVAGESFASWRGRLRMECARDWLEDGDRVGGVAARLGFAHQSALTRAYLRHFGIEPRRSRASAKMEGRERGDAWTTRWTSTPSRSKGSVRSAE